MARRAEISIKSLGFDIHVKQPIVTVVGKVLYS